MLLHERNLMLTWSFMLNWDFTIYNLFYYKSKLCVCVYAPMCFLIIKTHLYIIDQWVWDVWSEPTHTENILNANRLSKEPRQCTVMTQWSWFADVSMPTLKGLLLKTDATTPITLPSWISTCTKRNPDLKQCHDVKGKWRRRRNGLWINELAYTPQP